MSQDSAQRILQMYMQDNTNRLNQAMELAFREAQQMQLNEQETRKLLTQRLKSEQAAFNDYVAQLQKARTARARNDNDLARESMRIAYNNINENRRIDEKNMRVETKGIEEAGKIYSVDSTVVDDFAVIMNKVAGSIRNGDPDPAIMMLMNREGFSDKLANAKIKLSGRKMYDPYSKSSTKDYLMSDTLDQILYGISQSAGVDITDPKIEMVKQYITQTGLAGSSNKSGAWVGLDYKSPTDRQAAFDDYVAGYTDKFGEQRKGSKTGQFGAVTKAEKAVVASAQPVLDALSPSDDTPFQITESERRQLSKESLAAYEQLKDVYRRKPTVVTLDQAVLLDDIALQRALQAEATRTRLETPMAKPQSLEVTMARAAEIAEPRRAKASKPDMSKAPAHEQKYYATERKALELSDQDDDYVRGIGTPELYGVTKWKEVWNGEQMSSDYGTIVSEIEQQFPNPEDQLKALAAFNSRAMKLQRAKSPILVEGGKLSEDYKAALEAMSPKE